MSEVTCEQRLLKKSIRCLNLWKNELILSLERGQPKMAMEQVLVLPVLRLMLMKARRRVFLSSDLASSLSGWAAEFGVSYSTPVDI